MLIYVSKNFIDYIVCCLWMHSILYSEDEAGHQFSSVQIRQDYRGAKCKALQDHHVWTKCNIPSINDYTNLLLTIIVYIEAMYRFGAEN